MSRSVGIDDQKLRRPGEVKSAREEKERQGGGDKVHGIG
jgi:hypothetical protein